MKFDFLITIKKGFIGFITGLAAVVVFGVVQAITDYKPIVCSAEITTNCTPQFISTAYYAIVPTIVGFLVGVANWLKNRSKT